MREVGDLSHSLEQEKSLPCVLIVGHDFRGKSHSSGDYPGLLWHIYVSRHFLHPFFLLCLILQLLFPFGGYQNRKNLNILNVDPIFEQALAGRREQ